MAQGWHSTPWSSRALAWAVVADGSVSAISPRTLRQLGREVDLRPPRTRSWQTARVDDHFRVCAEQVRWCDAKAVGWAHTGRWVVCVDARPKGPMLDRTPLRRAIPGASAQQACADVRQGTVNGRVVWIVHTGWLEAVGVAQKDAEPSIQALRRLRQRHRWLRGVCRIQDGDPSPTAARPRESCRQFPWWWRPRFTPAPASWLHHAEWLHHACNDHDLTRRAWHEREECIAHLNASWPEYNRLYASPVEWTWTNQTMRTWFAQHAL